jgi:hypothetical protein
MSRPPLTRASAEHDERTLGAAIHAVKKWREYEPGALWWAIAAIRRLGAAEERAWLSRCESEGLR